MFQNIGKIYCIQDGFIGMGGTRVPPHLMKLMKVYFCPEWQSLVFEGLDNIGFKSKSRINNLNDIGYRLATEQEILLFWPENEKKGQTVPPRSEIRSSPKTPPISVAEFNYLYDFLTADN